MAPSLVELHSGQPVIEEKSPSNAHLYGISRPQSPFQSTHAIQERIYDPSYSIHWKGNTSSDQNTKPLRIT